jgi:hypothetical protein
MDRSRNPLYHQYMKKSHRRKSKRKSTALGQTGEFMLFIERDPSLSAKKSAAAVALVERICQGHLTRIVANDAFKPVATEAARRLNVGDSHKQDMVKVLVEDFKRDVDGCTSSPFCNLPAAAEKMLTSPRCRLK